MLGTRGGRGGHGATEQFQQGEQSPMLGTRGGRGGHVATDIERQPDVSAITQISTSVQPAPAVERGKRPPMTRYGAYAAFTKQRDQLDQANLTHISI